MNEAKVEKRRELYVENVERKNKREKERERQDFPFPIPYDRSIKSSLTPATTKPVLRPVFSYRTYNF